MIDELSLGLAPNVVDRLIDVVQQINRDGTALILVEQDVLVALDVASRAYVLENGRVALSGAAAEVRDDRGVRKAYLGLWLGCGRSPPPSRRRQRRPRENQQPHR
jgi:branched-chain amino acid transport system ATP-binding protein